MTRDEQWSKLLFNNMHLLRVAAVIANGDSEVDSQMLQVQIPLGQSSVHRILSVLEGVELLHRMERTSRTTPVRFTRQQHPFWAAAALIAEAAKGAV